MNEPTNDTGPASSPPARSVSPGTQATGYPRSGVSGQSGTEATLENRTPTPMATGQSGGTPDLSPGVVEIDTAHRTGSSESAGISSESGSAQPAVSVDGQPVADGQMGDALSDGEPHSISISSGSSESSESTGSGSSDTPPAPDAH